MHPLETYLQELRATRSSGAAVKETSFYPALANLLNEIGKTLKPKVRCIINLQNVGAGLPDGGLFTEEQIRNNTGDLLAGAIPARGAIEAKGTSADAWRIAESKQVKNYWSRYRQVLVTNYRDFVLVGADSEGTRTILETYRLASDEQDFWRKAVHPRAVADRQGESFDGFLKRVMLYQAALATPRDLAWFLASYAREAKFRIAAGDLPALAGIRAAMEEALGLKFEGARGDHFFRSALIQTLFYGIFSSVGALEQESPAQRPREQVRVGHGGALPPRADPAEALPRGRRTGPTGDDEPAGGTRLGGSSVESRGPRLFLRQLRGGPRRPVLLRAIPGSLRSGPPGP